MPGTNQTLRSTNRELISCLDDLHFVGCIAGARRGTSSAPARRSLRGRERNNVANSFTAVEASAEADGDLQQAAALATHTKPFVRSKRCKRRDGYAELAAVGHRLSSPRPCVPPSMG